MSAPDEEKVTAVRDWSARAAKRAEARQRELAEHVRFAQRAQQQAQRAADRVAARAAPEKPAERRPR
jgi:hypothetical protein